MDGRKSKPLSKAQRRFMAQLVVAPAVKILYMTYNNITGDYSPWLTIYCDGQSIYPEPIMAPFRHTEDPFRNYAFLQPLQDYVKEKTNDPNLVVFDYRRGGNNAQPVLNRNHPWYRELK